MQGRTVLSALQVEFVSFEKELIYFAAAMRSVSKA